MDGRVADVLDQGPFLFILRASEHISPLTTVRSRKGYLVLLWLPRLVGSVGQTWTSVTVTVSVRLVWASIVLQRLARRVSVLKKDGTPPTESRHGPCAVARTPKTGGNIINFVEKKQQRRGDM